MGKKLYVAVSYFSLKLKKRNVYKVLLCIMEENLKLLSIRNLKNLTLFSFPVFYSSYNRIFLRSYTNGTCTELTLSYLRFPPTSQTWQVGYCASQTSLHRGLRVQSKLNFIPGSFLKKLLTSSI